MRTRSVVSGPIHRLSIRSLAVAVVVGVSGFFLPFASALDITIFDIMQEGNETWLIVGEVDVNQEFGEVADITFGGAISGESTTTDHFGHFEYYFAAPFGSLISLTASTASAQSKTYEAQIFDPAGEP